MVNRYLLKAESMEAIRALALDELGPLAKIVSADKVTVGGVGGFFAEKHFEAIVEVPGSGPMKPAPPAPHRASVVQLLKDSPEPTEERQQLSTQGAEVGAIIEEWAPPKPRPVSKAPRPPAKAATPAKEASKKGMLVLTRKAGQEIMIGDGIVITILESRGDGVRVGISAPRDVPVHRGEVVAEIAAANHTASAADDNALAALVDYLAIP